MPEGLVAVSAATSWRRAGRRRHRRGARRLLRPLVCAGLIVIGLVAPVESASLPPVLEPLAGELPALAQIPPGTIGPGTPAPCPTDPVPWDDSTSESECVLVTPACPESPVQEGVFLIPSIYQPELWDVDLNPVLRYPGFCEERFFELEGDIRFEICRVIPNFIVRIDDAEIDVGEGPFETRVCRLIHPLDCQVGLYRTGWNTCRAVERRTWTCPAGSIHGNNFNSCYSIRPMPVGPNPACQEGSPDFVALTCEEYVGSDYAEDPALVDCAGYDTGVARSTMSANSRPGRSSDWWCEFNPSFLKVVCYSSNPPLTECGMSTALCLKRASNSGGCDAITETLRCRVQQALFVVSSVTVQEVRDSGCEPCVLLPFQPAPASCPEDLTRTPEQVVRHETSRRVYDSLFRVKQSYVTDSRHCRDVRDHGGDLEDYPDCVKVLPCEGAPQGRLTWKSTHHSGVAVINSPVILNFADLATEYHIDYRSAYSTWTKIFFVTRDALLGYDSENPGLPIRDLWDPTVRLWPRIEEQFSSVEEFASHRLDDAGYLGSCVLQNAFSPEFRIAVLELWPDTAVQSTEILELFGAQSLDWWNGLTLDEQQRHTEIRGLKFLGSPDVTEAEIEQELAVRAGTLYEEVLCDGRFPTWCRWEPTRLGYFRLTGASVWLARHNLGPRTWWDPVHRADELREALAKPENQTRVRYLLDLYGLQPSDVGLNSSLSEMLVHSPEMLDEEWLYTEEAQESFRCPMLDLRGHCQASTRSGIYAETEPVGIRVHEVRVVTRAPNT